MTTDGGGAAPRVVVEVDILSGAPNPTWTLDADSASRLVTVASDVTPAPGGAAPPAPGLGFRGFVVRGLEARSFSGSPGTDATLRVLGDDVVVTSGGRQVLYTDPRHAMYTLLREQALDHLPGSIASHIPAGGLRH